MAKQVNPDFLLRHLRCFANEHLHAKGGLDISQIEFHLPAFAVQRFEYSLRCYRRTQECGHENLTGGRKFPYREGVGRLRVLLGRHPSWPALRFVKLDQMVARTQRLAAAKVSGAPPCALLFKDRLDAPRTQGTEQEIACVIGI